MYMNLGVANMYAYGGGGLQQQQPPESTFVDTLQIMTVDAMNNWATKPNAPHEAFDRAMAAIPNNPPPPPPANAWNFGGGGGFGAGFGAPAPAPLGGFGFN